MIRNGENAQTLFGKSTDTKPVNGVNGNLFHTKDAYVEIDTGDVYFFDEDTNSWILPS